MADDSLQGIIPSASPIASYGIDPDELLASGDPAAYLAASRSGLPFKGTPTGSALSPGAISSMAQAAGTPQAAVAPAAKPGQPAGTAATQTSPYYPTPTGDAPSTTGFGQNLARAGQPTGAPAIPGTITPSGDPKSAVDPNQKIISNAAQMEQDYATQLRAQPTEAEILKPFESQRTLPPQEFDPNHPEYRPSIGRRIVRGLVGVGEGLARGGIRGALLGGLDPEAVGAAGYSAPTRAFSIERQRQEAKQTMLDKQEATAEKGYTADTARSKDVITSIDDIGKLGAAGQNAQARMDTAEAREKTARVQEQLADLKDQVSQTLNNGKMPNGYEAAVIASKLAKTPEERAAYASAARQIETNDPKKFQYADKNTAGPKSVFRQSMIDAATAQVQALQDQYDYNPRRNQYVNHENQNDILSPAEFTDRKNRIATRLDAQLGQKKMQPLGVRFNPADAGANKPTGRAALPAATPPATTPAPAANTPPASLLAKTPEGGTVYGQKGEAFTRQGGKWVPVPQKK
jgi:hypothetical protein